MADVWQGVETKRRGHRQLFLTEVWPNLRRQEALTYLRNRHSDWEEFSAEEQTFKIQKAEKWLDAHWKGLKSKLKVAVKPKEVVSPPILTNRFAPLEDE